MKIWSLWIVIGLLTFLIRLSFIAIFDKIEPPRTLRRALRFVPIAVLTAIIGPEIFIRDSGFITDPLDPKLIGGIIAAIVAYTTKNTIFTIIAGMAVLWGLPLLRATLGF